MSETSCLVCQSAATGLLLCGTHLKYLRDGLRELPWMLRELDVTIQKADKLHQVTGKSDQTTRSVMNIGASRLRDEVATLLVTSMDLLLHDLGVMLPNKVPQNFIGPLPHGVHRMSGMAYSRTSADRAVFMAHHAEVLARRTEVKDLYFAVIELVGNPDRPDVPGKLVATLNRRSRVFAGPCPTLRGYDDEGLPVVCNTALYAVDQHPDVTCPRCQMTVNVAENQRRAAEDRDLMPEAGVVSWMETLGEPVSKSTLQQWISSKRLAVHGFLHRGEFYADKPAYHAPRVVSLSAARALRAHMLQESERVA